MIPSLKTLTTQAILENFPDCSPDYPQWTYSEHFEEIDHPAFEQVKALWDSLKDQLAMALGPNCIMQDIEKSVLRDCSTCCIKQFCLSPDQKETVLANNVRLLFQSLCSTLGVTKVSFEDLPSSLKAQWEDEALVRLWVRAIKPALGQNDPILGGAADIRAWITNPDNAIFVDQFTRITVNDFKMKVIPPEIKNFKNLTYLSLVGNEIQCIPDFIGTLTNLKTLQLNNNQITCIDSVGTCENLKFLYLTNNKITSIPDSLLGLTKLEGLSLLQNKICIFPSALCSLKHLTSLDLCENPLFLYMDKREEWDGLNLEGEYVITFLEKAEAINAYECQGSLSLFVKSSLQAFHIDRCDLIKKAYEKLSQQDKDLICADLLFQDMQAFCEASVLAITHKYERLSLNQKEYVSARLEALEVKDPFANILLLSDIMAELENL